MNSCVIGLQWGDEGKGKIVDILSEAAEVVVRYSGGANAGHSVVRQDGEEVFALHLLPSGAVRENKICVIANGVVVDPDCLLGEIETLNEKDITLFLDSVDVCKTHVLVEATVNTFAFTGLIKDHVKEVIVANTFELKNISFTSKKTDKVDAYKLARILKVMFWRYCCWRTFKVSNCLESSQQCHLV